MKKEKNIIIIVSLVIISIAALSGVVYIITKHKDNKSNENNSWFELCEDGKCDDTIEMLKNEETAWTLTEINNKGEYVQIRHSFINFNGTRKDRFAFFKNDDEISGDFTINEKKEIILIPDDNKMDKITCQLGEEKDLIAVMQCDKDFGIFMLQKDGILALPNVIPDTISKTKKIVVKKGTTKNREITEENKINTLITIINSTKVWTGPINLPGPKYELELLDAKNNSIASILYNPNNYFTIEIKEKSYSLINIDNDLLDTIFS